LAFFVMVGLLGFLMCSRPRGDVYRNVPDSIPMGALDEDDGLLADSVEAGTGAHRDAWDGALGARKLGAKKTARTTPADVEAPRTRPTKDWDTASVDDTWDTW